MKYIQWIGSIIVWGVCVLIGLFFISLRLADPNKSKRMIETLIAQKTGYKTHLTGNLSWHFYPRLSVCIDHVSVNLPQAPSSIYLDHPCWCSSFSHLLTAKQQSVVSIAGVHIGPFFLRRVQGTFSWHQAWLTLHLKIQSLYQGYGWLNLLYKRLSSVSVPTLEWQLYVQDVQLQQLFQALFAESNYGLSGVIGGTFWGTTAGKTFSEWVAHSRGINQFSVRDGIIKGIDFNYLLEFANHSIQKLPINLVINRNKTIFTKLDGSILLKDGILWAQHLQMRAKQFQVTGQGQIILQNLILGLQLQVMSDSQISLPWVVPVQITGKLVDPIVKLDRMKLEQWMLEQSLPHPISKEKYWD